MLTNPVHTACGPGTWIFTQWSIVVLDWSSLHLLPMTQARSHAWACRIAKCTAILNTIHINVSIINSHSWQCFVDSPFSPHHNNFALSYLQTLGHSPDFRIICYHPNKLTVGQLRRAVCGHRRHALGDAAFQVCIHLQFTLLQPKSQINCTGSVEGAHCFLSQNVVHTMERF